MPDLPAGGALPPHERPTVGQTAAGPDRGARASDPLRIVQIAAPADVGGLERVVQGLAIGLARRGHAVKVIAVVDEGSDDHPFVRPLREAGLDFDLVGVPPRAYVREYRAVGGILRRFAPDVVHTHGYRPDLLDALAARRLRIPVVSTLHGSSRLGGASHAFEWLQERALRRFDGVIAVSGPLEEALRRRGVPGERLHTVPNGFTGRPMLDRAAARRVLGLPQDAFVVGWVGRLIPVKAADVLVDALARIRDLPWTAVLVGDGIERPRLEALVAGLGLEERVRLPGAVDDAGRLFPAFDLYALSSRTEGTPIVILEAMAAGLPIVATRVGGVPDVLPPGTPIAPPDDPDALARALRDLIGDRATRVLLGEAGRNRVRDGFGPERWLDRHEAIYRSVRRRVPIPRPAESRPTG